MSGKGIFWISNFKVGLKSMNPGFRRGLLKEKNIEMEHLAAQSL
jgi:hypothetical protein